MPADLHLVGFAVVIRAVDHSHREPEQPSLNRLEDVGSGRGAVGVVVVHRDPSSRMTHRPPVNGATGVATSPRLSSPRTGEHTRSVLAATGVRRRCRRQPEAPPVKFQDVRLSAGHVKRGAVAE